MDHIGHDIRTVDVTSVDHESVEMEAKAKQVAEVLTRHYPEHLWAVGWAPGGTLVVKNMAIPGNYGYTIDAAKSFSATDLAHTAMLAGGELLERCGFRRGGWNGEFATHVEGADPRHLNPI
jgi:hypothetical protein